MSIPAATRQPAGQPVTTGAGPHGCFAILFVCTGNVCRSVLAERLASRRLRACLGDRAAPFLVASAGTEGQEGAPPHPYTAAALTRLGAEAGGWSSRRLSGADIDRADLILCAAADHRDQVVTLRPDASRRAYLLKEFARLLAFAPRPDLVPGDAAWARCLVVGAARQRGRVPYVDLRDDEIGDPPATGEAFLDCARRIDAVLADVIGALCGA
jgi:protein-tyrosine phosphatase